MLVKETVWFGRAGRRDAGRDGEKECVTIKTCCVRKAISVKPQNSFASWENTKPGLGSILVNFYLCKLWWRLKCCAMPAQSSVSFSSGVLCQ